MLYPSEFGNDPLFPQSKDFKIEFKNFITGDGVVCLRSFKKGEHLAKLAGEIVKSIRPHSFQISTKKHLNDKYFIGHFIHSCDPNTEINTKELLATAIKDIEPGSYISIDYTKTEDYLFRQFKCNCGAKKCKKIIAGKKETPRSSLSMMSYYDDDSDDY
ncbi:MAG: SET domain-containing protein-lysine N-methyltransferase [Marinicella sp.]